MIVKPYFPANISCHFTRPLEIVTSFSDVTCRNVSLTTYYMLYFDMKTNFHEVIVHI